MAWNSKSVLTKEDLAVGTYRWSISKVIPEMTKVALATRKKADHEGISGHIAR